MKKILLISAAMVAACALSACSSSCASCSSCGKGDIYSQLNGMLGKNYSKIVLTTVETYDADSSLKSEYIMEYSSSEIKVTYTVERFASLSLDDLSSEGKTILSGTAFIKDGQVTGGEEVGISASIAYPKFTFKENYFSNTVIADNNFDASVKNISGFWGMALSCTDMKVHAEYQSRIQVIEVSYFKSGYLVEYSYDFTA